MPDSDANPFTAYADRTMTHRRPMRTKVVRSDADAPMKPTAMEKDQRDKSTQMRLYREYWREQIAVARSGEHGTAINELMWHIRKMTIDGGEALIDHVKRSKLPKADVFTRNVALHLVAQAIEHLRAVNGLAPFDDSLPGEDPTVFEIIRAELGVP